MTRHPPNDDAYARLRALVVRGELAPGARVSEATIADRLAVSRTPVREAMHRLQLEGLLVPDGGGARPRVAVAPLDPDEAREVYRTAGVLEGLAARGIAALRAGERRALATELREIDDRFHRASSARTPIPDRLFEAHHAFHARLVRAGAGPVLRAMIDVLQPRLERYEWFHGPLLRMTGLPFAPTYDEHSAIIAAVRNGDENELDAAVRGNWENAAGRLSAAICGAREVLGRQHPSDRA